MVGDSAHQHLRHAQVGGGDISALVQRCSKARRQLMLALRRQQHPMADLIHVGVRRDHKGPTDSRRQTHGEGIALANNFIEECLAGTVVLRENCVLRVSLALDLQQQRGKSQNH